MTTPATRYPIGRCPTLRWPTSRTSCSTTHWTRARPAGERASSLATLVSGANDATWRLLIRERIERGFGGLLAPRLDGADAALRAELLAALTIGIVVLREKVGTRALAETDRQTLGAWVDVMAAPLLAARVERAASAEWPPPGPVDPDA